MSTSTTTIELNPISRQDEPPSNPILENDGSSDSQAVLSETVVEGISKGRSAVIIVTVAGVNFLNTLGSGILTVALPQMARDLSLSRELLLWYVSIRYQFISFNQVLLLIEIRPASIYA